MAAELAGVYSCAVILSASLYAVSFYTTISFMDSIGIRGFDVRFETIAIGSSLAHLLLAIVASATIFMERALVTFAHVGLQIICFLVVGAALIGTFSNRDHFLLTIRNSLMRSSQVQKRNNCCNWDGIDSWLERPDCTARLCGPVFEEYYDKRANVNALLLTPAIFASGVALVLAAVLYGIQVGGRSEGAARLGAHDF
jgi:hypothetical protein